MQERRRKDSAVESLNTLAAGPQHPRSDHVAEEEIFAGYNHAAASNQAMLDNHENLWTNLA